MSASMSSANRRLLPFQSLHVWQLTDLHQLSKEEESQTTDAEVTREDQDEINRFSSLHNRVKILDAEVEARKVCLSVLSVIGIIVYWPPQAPATPKHDLSHN